MRGFFDNTCCVVLLALLVPFVLFFIATFWVLGQEGVKEIFGLTYSKIKGVFDKED